MLLTSLLLASSALPAAVQEDDKAPDVNSAVRRGVAALVEMQEGDDSAEWPYEGVYRVPVYTEGLKARNEIPMGYRVGGTSIVANALSQAPGFDDDPDRQGAIARAVDFVVGATRHELMDPEYGGGYDVRGWGYVYAVEFLVGLQRDDRVPKGMDSKVKKAVQFYLDGLEQLEIPGSGGWSYSRRGPLDQVSPTSPFMTGPALQALFAAKAQGYGVSRKLVERALDALERGLVDTGEVVYSSNEGQNPRGGMLPGSVGRMLVTETTLHLGGRGSIGRVRGAIDAFLVHWEWLDKRRAQNGTHVKPYGVAPYYFYYAHFYAAQAIEQLPEAEREEYRRRLRQKLFEVQIEGGLWNDRVFERTANYGTACAVHALVMPQAVRPATWGS